MPYTFADTILNAIGHADQIGEQRAEAAQRVQSEQVSREQQAAQFEKNFELQKQETDLNAVNRKALLSQAEEQTLIAQKGLEANQARLALEQDDAARVPSANLTSLEREALGSGYKGDMNRKEIASLVDAYVRTLYADKEGQGRAVQDAILTNLQLDQGFSSALTGLQSSAGVKAKSTTYVSKSGLTQTSPERIVQVDLASESKSPEVQAARQMNERILSNKLFGFQYDNGQLVAADGYLPRKVANLRMLLQQAYNTKGEQGTRLLSAVEVDANDMLNRLKAIHDLGGKEVRSGFVDSLSPWEDAITSILAQASAPNRTELAKKTAEMEARANATVNQKVAEKQQGVRR